MENILELRNITKLYPGVKALDDVSLSLREGEVHALIGENGAGKSTLIKTISGAIEPTYGQIVIRGKSFDMLTPVLSRQNGIAVVYQEFTLVPVLTAAENIFLGEFIRKGWICDQKAMNNRAAELFTSLKIELDPDVKVEDLTTGFQQIVEIAKAVSKNARILIMDEPSAPLTTNEVDAMFGIVETLKSQGVTVIYISHRMEEIFHVADRVSVLRDGKYIGTKVIGETNKDELIRMMVGRTLIETFPARDAIKEEIVLSVKELSGNGVENISFDLKKGEILGFGGLVGAGRTELAAILFGNAKKTHGEIIMKGENIDPTSPEKAIRCGISLVPEDRKSQGLILEMTIKENITAASMKKLSKRSFIKKKDEESFASEYVNSLNIKTPSLHQKTKNLSGGNQQKVVLGKWLGTNPEILIFDEPTRGIDVGAKQEIYRLMVDITRKGKSIIMISSDMEELLGMSDRMVILNKGRLSAILNKDEFSQEIILKYASEDQMDEIV